MEETVTIKQLRMYLYGQFQAEYTENHYLEVDVHGYTKDAEKWINNNVDETIKYIKNLY